MANVIIYGLVKALHDLATVLWIGGLIQLSFVILPAFRSKLKENEDLKPLLMDVQKRISVLVTISIPILIITGILESYHSKEFLGFFSFGNTYSALLSVKHILVITMICVAVSRKVLMRRYNQRTDAKMLRSKERASAIMVSINTLLGIAVIILSGLCAAMRS